MLTFSQIGTGASFGAVSDTSSMLRVAQETGGRTCTDQPDKCVERIDSDAKHYYVIGFYLNGKTRPGWHNLKVKMAGQKLSVRSRHGFIVEPFAPNELEKRKSAVAKSKEDAQKPAQKDARDDIVLAALGAPVDYTSVPLRLRWTKKAEEGGNTQVEFILSSPPGSLLPDQDSHSLSLDMIAYVKSTLEFSGEAFPHSIATTLTTAEENNLTAKGFAYRKRLTLAPGRYEVRFLLRDNLSQKIGTVSTLVDLSASAPTKQ